MNQQLERHITDAFKKSSFHGLKNIEVNVNCKTVTLKGRLSNYHAKQVAQTIAMKVIRLHNQNFDLLNETEVKQVLVTK